MRKKRIDWTYHLIELCVVFLGITLALLLNNWNDARRDRDLEQKYIAGFQNDLSSDITELTRAMEENNGHLKNLEWLQKRLTTKKFQEDTLIYLIASMGTFAITNLNDVTYESIKNSGSLRLIEDYDLRNAVISYYRLYRDKEVVEEVHRSYVFEQVLPVLGEHIDFVNQRVLSTKPLTEIPFTNTVSGEQITLRQVVAHYGIMLSEAKRLKQRLPG